MPVLLLEGSETPDGFKQGTRVVAGVLRDARVAVLDGQSPTADVLAPKVVADRLLGFLDPPR